MSPQDPSPVIDAIERRLTALEQGGGAGVETVTGAGVDNTDPRNPVVTGGGGLALPLVEVPISIDPADWTLNGWDITAGIATPPAGVGGQADLALPISAIAQVTALVLVVPLTLTGDDDDLEVWTSSEGTKTTGCGVRVVSGDVTRFCQVLGNSTETTVPVAVPGEETTFAVVGAGPGGTAYQDGVPYLAVMATGVITFDTLAGAPSLSLYSGSGDGGTVNLNTMRLLVATVPT